MEITDNRNKDKIAIVVVGYNRIDSIKRLLSSLVAAQYSTNNVPLYISIDASGDRNLYEYVESYRWPHGDKYVNIQKERLGLRKHIIQCGDLTKYFRAIVLLEDDVFVSEYFYEYVSKSVEFYDNETGIGGISLINNEMIYPALPRVVMEDGSDAYLMQMPASWGECWTENQWNGFKEWYENFSDDKFSEVDMPERNKGFKNAWTKYFLAYLIDKNKYFLYPYISLTTCFADAGVHSSNQNTIGQNNLLSGSKHYHFRPFNDMVKYDVYGINQSIYEWMGYSKSELCVDWYCQNLNMRKCRFILTPAKLNFDVVRTYGLLMRPIELNIKYNIEGDNLYLYDTIRGDATSYGQPLPLSLAFYHLRNFNMKLVARYALNLYWQAVKFKLGLSR